MRGQDGGWGVRGIDVGYWGEGGMGGWVDHPQQWLADITTTLYSPLNVRVLGLLQMSVPGLAERVKADMVSDAGNAMDGESEKGKAKFG